MLADAACDTLMRWVTTMALVAMTALGPWVLTAQSIQGRVTNGAGGQPVVNAVVTAESKSGERLARTLTNDAGRYVLRLNGVAARLQVVRIGFSPKSIEVPAGGGAATIDVLLDPLRTMLSAVEVRDNSNCSPR